MPPKAQATKGKYMEGFQILKLLRFKIHYQESEKIEASLVAQWLRICLAMQRMRVQSPSGNQDSTC